MPCHFEDHPTAPVTPLHSLVAIAWNRWSQSIGNGGRNQPVRAAATLYEVRNTFGERHSYLIPIRVTAPTLHQSCDKAFYVSPFLDMTMHYDFSIRAPDEYVAIAIRASQSNLPIMNACLTAMREPLTDRSLLRVFLSIPVLTLKVTAAIKERLNK